MKITYTKLRDGVDKVSDGELTVYFRGERPIVFKEGKKIICSKNTSEKDRNRFRCSKKNIHPHDEFIEKYIRKVMSKV